MRRKKKGSSHQLVKGSMTRTEYKRMLATQRRPEHSGYRHMWICLIFDLPTETPENRHDYAQFRKKLLQDGFSMMQYSVYVRPCDSEENAETHRQRCQAMLPPEGQVRIFMMTDKQYGRMLVFNGKKRQMVEKMPEQLTFF
jgi:CRISPR-associated protein Cas2